MCAPLNFKKYLPTREQLRQTRSLQFLGDMIFEPNLWHFNRHSLSFAVLVGFVCSFLPVPLQTIPAAMICIWIRCNIPVTLIIVWVSNPLTMPFMMYFAFRVGSYLLGLEQQFIPVAPSLEWITAQLGLIWQPLLLGALMCGFTLGITGFLLVHLYYHWRAARYKDRKRQK